MIRRLLLGAALLAVAGCGGPAGDPAAWRALPHDPGPLDLPARAVEVACPRTPPPGDPAGWTLALAGEITPLDAPLPLNEAERHVFRALYETLLRVDCDGRLQPGLARSWQAFDGGRFWVLRLRPGALFWDGAPVTPAAVMASWRRADTLCRLRGEPTPFLLFDPGASLSDLGDGELGIRLGTPSDQLPLALTHPALAVTGGVGPHGWPLGSGPCRPAGEGRGGRLVLEAFPDHPDRPIWSRLQVLLNDPRDQRELLDVGAHALVTRDRAVADYYAARPGVVEQPLPWDRWYYLLTPTEEPGADPRDRQRWTSGWNRLELAREVADQDAEPADFFSYEPPLRACPVLPPPVPVLPPAPSLDARRVQTARDADVLVWPDDDPEAGRLAERLAVLAARPRRPGPDLPSRGPLTPPVPPGPGDAPEAVAVPARELTTHVQSARAGAVLLPWSRRLPTPCGELGRLLSLAWWLQDAGLRSGASGEKIPPSARAADPVGASTPTQTMAVAQRLENDRAVQPLIRTRAHVVHHPDLVGLRWDHDGALLLWTAGWRSGALSRR